MKEIYVKLKGVNAIGPLMKLHKETALPILDFNFEILAVKVL